MTTNRQYPYAAERAAYVHGIGLPLDDLVPLAVREANQRVLDCHAREHDATEAVGRAANALQAAREEDTRRLGERLADGKTDATVADLSPLIAAQDEAERYAQATKHATILAAERLLDALATARAEGSLAAAVAALTARYRTTLAEVDRTVSGLRPKRDAAADDLNLARLLDAFPSKAHDYHATPPIGAGDAWHLALREIRRDLDYLAEATPLSQLPPAEAS